MQVFLFQGDFLSTFEGVIPNLERRYRETDSAAVREELAKYLASQPCPECKGTRLRREARNVFVGGKAIFEVSGLPLKLALQFFREMGLDGAKLAIAERIVHEIANRLQFLVNVGLDYLALDRSADSLSGGEAQRIRLASQIGSGLTGVMYVLDEPSIGLHQRDNDRLLATLKHLRDLGNSVIVVEHDHDAICAADYIVDMGPGAGEHGGQVVAQGTPEEIRLATHSLTGQYLAGRRQIPMPSRRHRVDPERMLIRDPHEVGHPLRDLSRKVKNLTVHRATVTKIDLAKRQLEFQEMLPMSYDYLVIGLGAKVNFFGVKGAEENAFPLYTLPDAVRLKNHILNKWEAADKDRSLIEDGALNVAIVGGGPTGVELAGACAELAQHVLARISQETGRDYRLAPDASYALLHRI
jgi:ABC-type cobalamin transport system ATPase subunit